MNIIIFAGYYLPHTGGYCKNIRELARRLVDRGHKIDIVTCNTENSPISEIIDRVHIIRLPLLVRLPEYPVPAPSKRLLSLFTQGHYDVAITQSRIFLTSATGLLYASVKRIPVIHVERGGQHTVTSNPIFTRTMRLFDHTLGWGIVTIADEVVAISQSTQQFIRHLSSRADPLLIHNGMEMPASPPRTDKARPSAVNIVFVGRLIYGKGVQDLIDAIDNPILSKYLVRLYIIGDGPYRAELEQKACATSKYISFLGEMPQNEIIPLLREADIFVNPSYSEGMPTSVMEAAAAGLPIVATDVGGTSEIIQHGYSGLLVEPHRPDQIAGALDSILETWTHSLQMGYNAYECMKDFSWAGIVDQWEALLRDVVDNHGRREQ